jgi:ferredoxin
MAKPKMATIQIVRRVTLGVMLVGLTVLTYLHQRMQGIPTIDTLDPFGGLETLMRFVGGGDLIKKIEPGTLVLFGGVVALGIVLSRFFCGWFCAFGALQGIFGWVGRKLFKKRPTVPAKVDRYLRWLKYPVLVLIIYFTWKAGDLVIRPYDPLAAYGHLSAGLTAITGEFLIGFILLIASLVLSVIYERAFCKYLCPLGAVNAILSRVPFFRSPLFRIRRVASTCISCSKCDKTCPMNVDISKPDAINDPECIGCMECVTACPTKVNSLEPTLGGKAVKLGLVVALGFVIYGTAGIVGQVAGFAPKSLDELAATGKLSVSDIKGSSTWEMVAESYGVELEKLHREAKVDMGRVPRMTMLKDTAKLIGSTTFTPDTVRIAVAKILGVPYTPEAEGGMAPKPAEASMTAPAPAAASPAEKPATAAPAAEAPKPTPTATPTPAATAPAKAAAAPAAAAPANAGALVVPGDFVLEGTMNIREIAAALKAPEEAVIAKLGLPADLARDKPLRDMKDQYGYTMPDLKDRIKR